MGRKVIKQGNNTLTITLPRKWTSKFQISGGDEVEAEVKGRNLVLSTSKDVTPDAIEFEIESPEKFLRRFIDVRYRHGHDEIKINFKDSAVLPMIQKETENLLGFEIVEQGRTYCILKNVAVAMESEFDTIIKRIFLMLKTNFSEMLESVKTGKFNELESVIEMEKINNKLVNFCQRTVNKRGFPENWQTTATFYVVCQLEQLADAMRDLCKVLVENKQPLSKDVITQLEDTEIVFNAFYKLYYKFDNEQLVAMNQKELWTMKHCRSLIRRVKGAEVLIIHYIMTILREIHHITDMI